MTRQPKRILTWLFCIVLLALGRPTQSEDWPGWRGKDRAGIWREEGIVEKLPEQLPILWRHPVSDGYAGPAVSKGRVFVMDRALERGENNPDNPFDRSAVQGYERVLCLNADTGDEVWVHRYRAEYTISYPAGPRATPQVDDDRVYTLGAMGELRCLSTDAGKVLWSKNFVRDFGTEINNWGMAAAPLVDGDHLILLAGGKDGAGVICLDKRTAEVRWKALEAPDPGYAAPCIFGTGDHRQLIAWLPDAVYSLDPATGRKLWEEPFALNFGLSVMTPVFDEATRRLFVSSFYNGPLMLELSAAEKAPAAKVLWRGKSESEQETDGLHALMCTPYFKDGYIYGICSYGQLRCLKAATGKRIWETFAATGEGRWWNAFLIPHGDKTVICNEQGDLIFAELSPKGYREIGRTRLIAPTRKVRRRETIWSHPAFAGRRVYARNDKEIICADLAITR